MLAWPEDTIYSRPMPPAVADPFLVAVTDTLVNRFAPERVVLFGSRARGDHQPESADVLRTIKGRL